MCTELISISTPTHPLAALPYRIKPPRRHGVTMGSCSIRHADDFGIEEDR